jgi:hypothetical protein
VLQPVTLTIRQRRNHLLHCSILLIHHDRRA